MYLLYEHIHMVFSKLFSASNLFIANNKFLLFVPIYLKWNLHLPASPLRYLHYTKIFTSPFCLQYTLSNLHCPLPPPPPLCSHKWLVPRCHSNFVNQYNLFIHYLFDKWDNIWQFHSRICIEYVLRVLINYRHIVLDIHLGYLRISCVYKQRYFPSRQNIVYTTYMSVEAQY